MPRPDPWVLAAAAALSVALAVLVVFQGLAALREWRLRKHALSGLRDPKDRAAQSASMQDAVVHTRNRGDTGFMAELATQFPRLWDLHHLLAQSGLGWTMEGYVLRTGASGAITGLLLLLMSGNPWVAGVGGVLATMAPFFYVRRRKTRRIMLLEQQLPEAIDLIARAVRAGHPLSAGLGMAAEEAPEPLASEFRITFDEQKFGLPFEEALLGLGDRVEVIDVKILITAILVQREVGGNLSEILETIAETMRARFSLKRQVRVYTAQGRMSGTTLAALPIIVGLAITLINPDYMSLLFHETLGRALLATAAVLQVIGFLWIRRIVDIRY